MNDVTYAEAARKLAERMIAEGGTDPRARLDYGFRLATARHASVNEIRVLERSFRYHLDRYQTDPKAADPLHSWHPVNLPKGVNTVYRIVTTAEPAPLLSVVIPAFNEHESLQATVDAVVADDGTVGIRVVAALVADARYRRAAIGKPSHILDGIG